MRATISSIWLGPTSSAAAGVPSRGRRRRQAQPGARLVEDVDRAVGQTVVAQVPRRQLRRGLERVVREANVVVGFVSRPEALQNAHGLGDRRLVDRDLLQPARERPILLDVLVFLVGRRAHHAKLTGRENRLDQRGEVHRAAGRGAGADGRVDLVDEEDRHRTLRERVNHRLEALLEVAAEPGAGEERRRVEREDLRPLRASPGTSSWSSRVARPSASAVLPTPASPTNTGLFFRRRQRISSVRCSSAARPISGSSAPFSRASVRLHRVGATAGRARPCRRRARRRRLRRRPAPTRDRRCRCSTAAPC